MKCPTCSHKPLQALVSLPDRVFDLAQKRGSINISHVERTVLMDWKIAWEKDKHGDPREVRSPIFCPECLTEYVYRVGHAPALMTKVKYDALVRQQQRSAARDEAALPLSNDDE